MVKPFCFTLLVLCVMSTHAQQTDKFRFVDVKLHGGVHAYTGELLTDALTNGYAALELRYAWQSTGTRDWEAAYNYPAYGFGFYTGYVGDIETFGNPNALYGFITFTLNNPAKRNVLMIEPALGLTYNLIPYDPETNKSNDAIGSRMAVYFNLNFGGAYKLTRELDLIYGIDFTHFSNGRTFVPNCGLNMVGGNIGTRYYFNRAQKQLDPSFRPQKIAEARPPVKDARKPRSSRQGGLFLYQAFGTVQNYIDEGTDKRYLTSSTVLEWQHRFTEMHGLSMGVDGFVDKGMADTNAYPLYNTYQTTFFPGAHIGYDFSWWRFTASVQFGYLLTEAGREMKSPIFTRPALKCHLNQRLYAQIGLKTYKGATADWVEFGVGVRLVKR